MKESKKLDELREKIDKLDKDIVELINERAKVVLEVGKTKTDENREFYNPERERQIYERLRSINKGPFPEEALKSVFREIISASLSMEKPINIAFLGPHATFTHQAAIKHFGQSGNFIAREDIPGVFDEVERGRANYGVVPIESTAEGAVSHTLDMFVDSPLQICAEVLLEVSSSLLNKSGKVEDIERVCSHPHALAQCGRWLKETLPGVVAVEVSSTAQAAQMAADDEKTAAIAGEAAASLYGLRVAQKSIQDNPYNYTRFLVIGKREAKRTGNDKTSVIFAIKDSPGALYDILKPLSEKGINLSKIESRPLKTKAWEYVFYIDMDGYKDDEDIARSIEGLNKRSSFMKVLGSYEKNSVGK